MKKFIVKEVFDEASGNNTAGSKARIDIEYIAEKQGFHKFPIYLKKPGSEKKSIFKQVADHIYVYNTWKSALDEIEDAYLIIQFPIVNGFIFLKNLLTKLKKKNVKTIAVIHDLETLRAAKVDNISYKRRKRLYIQEIPPLREFDYIVSHNNRMTEYLVSCGIKRNHIIDLNIFDYIVERPYREKYSENNAIIVAGNLSRQKAAYIYNLPSNVSFELYGTNYLDDTKRNVHYNGAFPADQIVDVLDGKFGLIWDGNRRDTCNGVFGEYLKYNNPHKTSLYLAAGIPVIVWSQAAIKSFIVDNELGVAIDSLDDLNEVMRVYTGERYKKLKDNAQKMSDKLRTGHYFKEVIKQIR